MPPSASEEFARLPRADADDLFLELSSRDQWELLSAMPVADRRSWVRLLPPDDAADAVQAAPEEERAALLALLDDRTRSEVTALLAYAEDDAGGLMSTRFARVRPDMTVDEAIAYLRRQTRDVAETIYAVYVLDPAQRLLGVISFRELFEAAGNPRVGDIMEREVVSATEDMDQEQLAQLFRDSDLLAIPVVDPERRVKGMVTVDDIVDVVTEADTEDMQKMGGSESLGAPYGEIGFWSMFRKRGGWLAALFLGEMLTATAMAAYEHADRARGGAGALHPAHHLLGWKLRVAGHDHHHPRHLPRRGAAARHGTGDGARGGHRPRARPAPRDHRLDPHRHLAGGLRELRGALPAGDATVGLSLVGVVLFGTLVGATLPFLLRRAGFDPASASAPLVATVVDVAGLVIYFSVAGLVGSSAGSEREAALHAQLQPAVDRLVGDGRVGGLPRRGDVARLNSPMEPENQGPAFQPGESSTSQPSWRMAYSQPPTSTRVSKPGPEYEVNIHSQPVPSPAQGPPCVAERLGGLHAHAQAGDRAALAHLAAAQLEHAPGVLAVGAHEPPAVKRHAHVELEGDGEGHQLVDAEVAVLGVGEDRPHREGDRDPGAERERDGLLRGRRALVGARRAGEHAREERDDHRCDGGLHPPSVPHQRRTASTSSAASRV